MPKTKNTPVFLDDKENVIYRFPKFIHRLFLKSYFDQGMVYLQNGLPCHCSNKLLWLEELIIKTTTEKRANKLAWKYFNEKYPQYKDYVQLF